MLLGPWFSASGSKFSDFIFSLWAACLLFAISTPVMLSAVHCSSYSCLVKPNPVWPQTEWWQGSDDSVSVISPSFLKSTLVCLTLTLSLFVCWFPFFSSLHWNTSWKKGSASMYLFVFCVFAQIIACVYLWCAHMAALRSCQVDKKETSKASPREVNNCESRCVRNVFPLLLLSRVWTSMKTQQERKEEAL